jgi:phosphoglycerate dehydrogenase-like enzyme
MDYMGRPYLRAEQGPAFGRYDVIKGRANTLTKEPVNVVISQLVGSPYTEEYLGKIRAVSPRVRLQDISDLVKAEMNGDSSAIQLVDAILADTEVFFGAPLPVDIIKRAPRLMWIQSPLAGTDWFLTPAVIESPVILTKARIHATQISEAVFNMMLMLARRSLEYFRHQQQKEWERLTPSILHSKTVGILGLGNIGQAVARLAKAFGMKVIATKAHPEIRAKHVDLMLPPSDLNQILEQSDFLVILLPITPETQNIIGEAELRLMKPTTYFINVGRGGVVDEPALIRALSEKWIAGAALDVFVSDPDPLPYENKLWDLPNVIITPHISGGRPDGAAVLTQLFCKNLRRYLMGKELLNVVDKERGY